MSAHVSRVGINSVRGFNTTLRSSNPLAAVAVSSSRPFSTTPLRLLATPQTGPTHVGRDPHAAEHVRKAVAQQQMYTPDYSKGPSALDKASSLFFFTEIVRGELFLPFHLYCERRQLTLRIAPSRYGCRVGTGSPISDLTPHPLLLHTDWHISLRIPLIFPTVLPVSRKYVSFQILNQSLIFDSQRFPQSSLHHYVPLR
jgi:hypothetical protein